MIVQPKVLVKLFIFQSSRAIPEEKSEVTFVIDHHPDAMLG